MQNGDNEILFELDELTQEELDKMTSEIRTLLSRYQAFSVIVNNNDWD